jgi:hypothetical protein
MLDSSYIIVRDVRGADWSYSNACGEIMKELLLSEKKKSINRRKKETNMFELKFILITIEFTLIL